MKKLISLCSSIMVTVSMATPHQEHYINYQQERKHPRTTSLISLQTQNTVDNRFLDQNSEQE